MDMKVVHSEFGSCRINEKGYPRINGGPRRNQYLHRAVWEETAGIAVPPGFQIHHMNGKRCWCPHQLVALQSALHVSTERRRDPYTGQFMTGDEFARRYPELLSA